MKNFFNIFLIFFFFIHDYNCQNQLLNRKLHQEINKAYIITPQELQKKSKEFQDGLVVYSNFKTKLKNKRGAYSTYLQYKHKVTSPRKTHDYFYFYLGLCEIVNIMGALLDRDFFHNPESNFNPSTYSGDIILMLKLFAGEYVVFFLLLKLYFEQSPILQIFNHHYKQSFYFFSIYKVMGDLLVDTLINLSMMNLFIFLYKEQQKSPFYFFFHPEENLSSKVLYIGTLVLMFMILKVQICSWLYYYRIAALKSNKFFNFPKFFHVSGEEISVDLKNYNKFHWFFYQKFYDNLIYMIIYNKFFLVLDKKNNCFFYILQGVTAQETKFLNEFILDKIQKKSTSGYKHPETFKKIFNDPRYKNINIASVIIIS